MNPLLGRSPLQHPPITELSNNYGLKGPLLSMLRLEERFKSQPSSSVWSWQAREQDVPWELSWKTGAEPVSSRYDPMTQEWRCGVARLSEGKRDMGVAELGSYLYCVGGRDGMVHLSTVEKYDPRGNRWCKMAPMTCHRTGLGVAVLDGYLYAIGGSDGQSPLYSVERYNPEEDAWSSCPPLGTYRENFGCAMLQGKIYAVGGHDDFTELCSAERFDPVTNEWSQMMPMKSKKNK
ncbi:unnamed protein product, partial [Natator depressus]